MKGFQIFLFPFWNQAYLQLTYKGWPRIPNNKCILRLFCGQRIIILSPFTGYHFKEDSTFCTIISTLYFFTVLFLFSTSFLITKLCFILNSCGFFLQELSDLAIKCQTCACCQRICLTLFLYGHGMKKTYVLKDKINTKNKEAYM